ncbi:hypothetical protein [Thalassotalea atypica]|uniref:hypothetical protein n=1 Tax=Thalassotalea atypica TaxID=2054316 RepID=UPI0025745117|nr:hypothetical protein [Thalassotalea atypica]
MTNNKSAYLFIFTGLLFLISGIIDSQISYYGVALMFIIIGMVGIFKNKNNTDNTKE